MGELQSCASLVKASALCSRSHDLGLFTVECSTRNNGCSSHGEFLAPPDLSDCEEKGAKGEGVDVVAAISAELQREREKNEELMERISILEAQLKEREKAYLLTADQDGCPSSTYKSFKKFKRQKIEIRNEKVENIEVPKNTDTEIEIKHNIPCMKLEYNNQHDRAVNWMSMDVTQFLNFDKYKDGDSSADFEDTDDSDDDDDCYDGDTDINDKDRDEIDDTQVVDTSKIYSMSNEGGVEYSTPCVKQEIPADKNKVQFTDTRLCQVAGNYTNKKEHKKDNSKESKNVRRFKASLEIHSTGQELGQKGSGSLLSNRKPPKVAFCPKEVRGIMESEALLVKNAQSHTIRKIIVFASLGIRHGCEDMYELDFNHFSILRKGEPYVSPKNPGEHALYEHPGVRRKVFYANRQNPILCPVQILEEEKAMRPSDPSCPSCLFLCIKYGGRTRNLPQNEYVRQRMGRNKLKSFGPLMCQMALLVHIRSGSFFFKALGITLLFMAGFPDDLVQRETKYRNLDLLQKYYRTDEDAEGEDLFHPYPMVSNTHTCPNSRQIPVKAISTSSKSCGKKQSHQTSKPQNTPRSEILPSISSGSMPQSQFGLMGYASVQTQAPATLQSVVSHSLTNSAPISVAPISSANPNISYMGPHPYSMLPPYPMNTFIPPPPYWHNTNTYPYPSSYGYQSFPYLAHHSQPYYSQPPCTPFVSKAVEGTRTKDPVLEEADSDSDSSSSGSEQKKLLSNCK